ncbi:hypothetical protein LTR37_008864 [Vermiconidia calcicola]|uniref:Uncharacterized protein n=1 Tax=Vermiconidia calcicola TaxID=1690605 RepID=A0ACC3N990_9PEZI|nr:hypothetical protein LTR37_008864 [Vermiconidia calcicola]
MTSNKNPGDQVNVSGSELYDRNGFLEPELAQTQTLIDSQDGADCTDDQNGVQGNVKSEDAAQEDTDNERLTDEEQATQDRFETCSHFSDSSSDGEEADPSVEEDDGRPLTRQRSRASWAPEPAETTIDDILIQQARENLGHDAVINKALRPYIGFNDGTEGELARQDHKLWMRQGRPPKSQRPRDPDDASVGSHGMPSLLAATESDAAAAQRSRIQLDLAKREMEKVREKLARTKQELRAAERELEEALDERREALDERKFYYESAKEAEAKSESLQHIFRAAGEEIGKLKEVAKEREKQLTECRSELAKAKVEAQQWKASFEKQRPLAMAERERRMRREQELSDVNDVGTQTEPVETNTTAPEPQVTDASNQTDTGPTGLLDNFNALKEHSDQLGADNLDLERKVEELESALYHGEEKVETFQMLQLDFRRRIRELEKSLAASESAREDLSLRKDGPPVSTTDKRLADDLALAHKHAVQLAAISANWSRDCGERGSLTPTSLKNCSILPSPCSSSLQGGRKRTELRISQNSRSTDSRVTIAPEDGGTEFDVIFDSRCADTGAWSIWWYVSLAVLLALMLRCLPPILRPWPL